MKGKTKIILRDLPKISLNRWYAGNHWSIRKKIKDVYHWQIKAQHRKQFPKNREYEVEYLFVFKSRPLDASNCIAAVKLIEDVLFADDDYQTVKKICVSSRKEKDERVEITIKEIK